MLRSFSALLLAFSSLTASAARYQGQVVSIHDGDTLQVQINGNPRPSNVRLVGIDAPEIKINNDTQGQPAKDARDSLRSMLPIGASVEVVTDEAQASDKNNRLLGRIIYQGVDLNERMLRDGWAVLYVIAPYDKTMMRDYYEAAKEGFEQKRGIFSGTYPNLMLPYQFRLRVLKSRPTNLVGNFETKRLYSQRDIESIPVYARVFFPSEESARDRGFQH